MPQAIPQVQILITKTDAGQVGLQTTTTDPVEIYGLLELAKEAARENFARMRNGNGIVPATADALNKLQAVN